MLRSDPPFAAGSRSWQVAVKTTGRCHKSMSNRRIVRGRKTVRSARRAGVLSFTPQSSAPHFVNRKRPRPLKREYQECRKVQQIEFIADGTEPGAGSGNTQQLHGAESVWQMNLHHGHEQNESGGNARPEHKSSDQ